MIKIIVLLSILLSFGQSFAADIWDTRQSVPIAWDPVQSATSYLVWIKPIEPEGTPALVGEYAATQTTLVVSPGKWVFGVAAKNATGPSAIAWSDNPTYTYQGNIYRINYQAPVTIPPMPSGLRIVTDQPAPAQNLLANGDFEGGFASGVANGWESVTDGGAYVLAQDAGRTGGNSQKITVTTVNTWGMFFVQRPAFVLNQWYTASFWYKTQGMPIYASVCNDPHTQVVIDKALPDTLGEWKLFTFDFQWTNSQADGFRVAPNTISGVFWIDDVKVLPRP